MLNRIIPLLVILVVIVGEGCTLSEPVVEQVLSEKPVIFPDYLDVTLPANIAPLRFELTSAEKSEAVAVIACEKEKLVVSSEDIGFRIPEKGWKRLMKAAVG